MSAPLVSNRKLCLVFAPDQDQAEKLTKLAEPFFNVCAVSTVNEGKRIFTESISQVCSPVEFVIAKAGREAPDLGIELLKFVRELCPSTFNLMHSSTVSNSGKHRISMFNTGAVNMVSNVDEHCVEAIEKVAVEGRGNLSCPYCNKAALTAEQMYIHLPMYHINDPTISGNCPICQDYVRGCIQRHVFDKHGPPGAHVDGGSRVGMPLVSFSLCVVQRHTDGKFLVVQERTNKGFWLPGGGIDAGEDPIKAAVRETKEEAGIDIKLTGILRLEVSCRRDHQRMRYIFFAQPLNALQKPKTLPDHESVGACWLTLSEVAQVKLRSDEPLKWFRYISDGGTVYPMDILKTSEHAPV